MAQSSYRGTGYASKFGLGAFFLVALVVAASANLYTSLAPELSGEQQAQLLSGVVTILLALVIGLLFVGAVVGRESLVGLSVLTERARQMEQGDLDVELETNKADEVGQLYRSLAAMRDALRQRIQDAEEQSENLQDVASEYSEVMEAVGDGDLSRRLDEDVDNEAMAQLAREFNDMVEQLEETVAEVYAFTDEVSTAADMLAHQTEASMRASARIHSAAQDIAVDGREATTTEDIEYIESEIETGVEANGEDAVEPADSDRVEIEETLEAIRGLSGQMDRIDEISEFISDVANETNMLALNAGIEASKVEQGDVEGFQAVADEVKSLAEETKESADEIETITDDIRGGTSEAVNSLLRQQAALLSMMHEQVGDLSTAAEDLRLTLTRLTVADTPEVGGDEPELLEPPAED